MRIRHAARLAPLFLVMATTASAWGQTPEYPTVEGSTYKIETIAPGVYLAVGPGGSGGSNDIAIENGDSIVLVDTSLSPERTRRFLADLRKVTTKPVRMVINTHWHYDHVDGNQVFGPDIPIIGHDYAYQAITSFDPLHREPFITSQPFYQQAAVDALRARMDAEQDPARKAELAKSLADAQLAHQQLQEIKPTPPNVTFSDSMTIHGTHEIRLLFLGRGHTASDIVVYLPQEKIVCTGDMMEAGTSFTGDSFPDEWIAALEKLKQLDWTTDLPGHGAPFHDKAHVTAFQSYIRDVAHQVAKLHAKGLSPEQAAPQVDMTAHAQDFPGIKSAGIPVREVRGLYAWIDSASPAARKFLSER